MKPNIISDLKKINQIDIDLLHPIKFTIQNKVYFGYGTTQHITKDMLTKGLIAYGISAKDQKLYKIHKNFENYTMVFFTKDNILQDQDSIEIDEYVLTEYLHAPNYVN